MRMRSLFFPFPPATMVQILRRSLFFIWTGLWWKNHPGVEATSFNQVRDAETAFLHELHAALNMDQKSQAVHNWFRNRDTNESDSNNIHCGFTGVQCDELGLVTILDLSSLGLDGTLPSSFSSLTRLQRILLRNNDIGGSLPCQLPETLVHLNVDGNRLQGTIPSSWDFTTTSCSSSSSSSLERLVLSNNLLEGSLPTTICSFRKLKALNLSRNKYINGTLPPCLANLKDLRGLQVTGTRIVGPILPPELCHIKDSDDTNLAPQVLPLEGLCERFRFCLDGYQQVSSDQEQDGIKRVSCEACSEPSNALASRTCVEWSQEPRTSPSASQTSSQAPTTSTTTGRQFPSVMPTCQPTAVPSLLRVPSASPASPWNDIHDVERNDDLVSSYFPTFQSSSTNSSHQQKQQQQQQRAFYDEAAFFPVLILLSLFGSVTLFATIPILWRGRSCQKRRGFYVLGATPPPWDNSTYFSKDEDNKDDEDGGQDDGQEEEEITFFKDDTYSGVLDGAPDTYGSRSSTGKDDRGDCANCRNIPAVTLLDEEKGTNKNDEMVLTSNISSASSDTMASLVKRKRSTSYATFSSTIGSFLCAPTSCTPVGPDILVGINQTPDAIMDKQDEMWTFSCHPPPPPLDPPQPGKDSGDRPDIAADSSSLSSTTPMLNPIDSLTASTMFAPLSRWTTSDRNSRVLEKDPKSILGEYARKYFPDISAATPPTPVGCFADAFRLTVCQDAPPSSDFQWEEQTHEDKTTSLKFRPPKFYKKTDPPTTAPPQGGNATQDRTHTNEDGYLVLGIRSPFVNHHESDDEYEVEFLEDSKQED